jgi:formylglycine-generating enzyme required for sulfatase activity
MYASDEQRLGQPPAPADDVHALGVMLYQVVVGDLTRAPSKTFAHALQQRHVNRALISVITQAIADREDRYVHAGELAAALRQLPSQLIVAPEVVRVKTPAEEDAELRAKFDDKVQAAKHLNAEAQKFAEQRQWKQALASLERIFHPVLRDAVLYQSVSVFAAGQRLINSVGMEFAYVPAGESWLGGGNGTPGTKRFVLGRPLLCGIHPVTQAQWHAVMNDNPSHFKGNPRYPVESVSWDTITQKFLPALNKKCVADGYAYSLPTEEEWEYICRGGPISQNQSAFSYYFARSKTDWTPNPTNELTKSLACFGQDGNGKPCEVGAFLPNPLGIYDLHGLVWEWTTSAEGAARVNRGGSWNDSAENCTAAYRGWNAPVLANNNLGFRLLAVPLGK